MFYASGEKPVNVRNSEGKVLSVFSVIRAYKKRSERDEYVEKQPILRHIVLSYNVSDYDYIRCMECVSHKQITITEGKFDPETMFDADVLSWENSFKFHYRNEHKVHKKV